jgi:hypothetical protein
MPEAIRRGVGGDKSTAPGCRRRFARLLHHVAASVALLAAFLTTAESANSDASRHESADATWPAHFSPVSSVLAAQRPQPGHALADEEVPDHNREASPTDWEDCRFAPPSNPACVAAAIADIDAARAEEGLAPITLPDDFEQLTVTQQLLVVTDLERVDRGLEPFEGLSPRLDAYAQQGAEAGTDPPWPEPMEGFLAVLC